MNSPYLWRQRSIAGPLCVPVGSKSQVEAHPLWVTSPRCRLIVREVHRHIYVVHVRSRTDCSSSQRRFRNAETSLVGPLPGQGTHNRDRWDRNAAHTPARSAHNSYRQSGKGTENPRKVSIPHYRSVAYPRAHITVAWLSGSVEDDHRAKSIGLEPPMNRLQGELTNTS